MAVDSTKPDIPALRIIPADRLLPDDELWGWRMSSGKAGWHLWRAPVIVLAVTDVQGAAWDYIRVIGREVSTGKHIVREIANPGETLVLFRTNTYAVGGDELEPMPEDVIAYWEERETWTP